MKPQERLARHVALRVESEGRRSVRRMMMTIMRRLILALILVIAAGCVMPNPYANFYRDLTGGRGVMGNDDIIPPDGDPKIVYGTSPRDDTKRMQENGYVAIGYSSFNASQATEWQALQQGRCVHADTVILYQNYTETLSGVDPITFPQTETINTDFSATGGGGTLQGNAVQTRTAYHTTYKTHHVRRYDFVASYWVKGKPRAFGARLRDLTDVERKQLGSNKGAVVTLVIRGSPAFNADIIPGDILKRVGDHEVLDDIQIGVLFQQYRGKAVVITVVRDGNTLTKTVELNP